MSFAEQIRQQEEAAKAEEAKITRPHNLQYGAIAILLISLSVIFMILSRTAKKYPNLLEYLGVIGLLMLFQFIKLLLHPFLGSFTHHSPFLMLMLMMVTAALLVPLHYRLEGSLFKKLGKEKH